MKHLESPQMTHIVEASFQNLKPKDKAATDILIGLTIVAALLFGFGGGSKPPPTKPN